MGYFDGLEQLEDISHAKASVIDRRLFRLIKLFLNKLKQDLTVKLITFVRVQDKAFQIGIACLARAPQYKTMFTHV